MGDPYNAPIWGGSAQKGSSFRIDHSPLFFLFFFSFHHWKKKCLEIRKFAKFESDLLKTNEDIGRPQSREILQTFVWWGVGDSLVSTGLRG